MMSIFENITAGDTPDQDFIADSALPDNGCAGNICHMKKLPETIDRDWIARAQQTMSDKKITQEQLAERIDKSQGSISGYLSGKKSPPFSVMCEIADSLLVPRPWLVFGIINTAEATVTPFTQEEQSMMEILRTLTPPERRILDASLSAINNLRDAEKRKNSPRFHLVESRK